MLTRHTASWCLIAIVLGIASKSQPAQADVVKWRTNIDSAKIEATQTGKLVLLHFWSTSCGPCRVLDSNVFTQPQVSDLLEQHYVPVKVNADLSPALSSAYGIERVPTDIVLSAQGNVVARLACPQTPAEYGTQLLNLAQHYQKHTAAQNTPMQAPIQSAYAGLKVGQYNNASAGSSPVENPMATTPNASPPTGATPTGTPQMSNNAYAAPASATQVTAQPSNPVAGNYQNPHMTAMNPPAAQPGAAQQ